MTFDEIDPTVEEKKPLNICWNTKESNFILLFRIMFQE